MANLPVNFTDDILSSSMNGKRRYKMIDNGDGTVSFEDVSSYDQVGSNFGSAQINQTNEAVNNSFDKNKIVNDLTTLLSIQEEGYVPGTEPIKELNSKFTGIPDYSKTTTVKNDFENNTLTTYTIPYDGFYFARVRNGSETGGTFIRIQLNGCALLDINGLSSVYAWLTSPIYFIKKDTKINIQLAGTEERELFYIPFF